MPSENFVSVVLPCYNPQPGWEESVEANFIKLTGILTNIELIIVNDGSTRNFEPSRIKKNLAQYPVTIVSYDKNRGKGYALRQGVKQAKGDIIIYTDIDFPYSFRSFLDIHASLNSNGLDVAVGLRSENYYTHLPVARVRISRFLKTLRIKSVQVELREGVQLSHMPWKILIQESGNFLKILYRSMFDSNKR
jgi:glycosyltransferase involved in cell wall biosynthesis